MTWSVLEDLKYDLFWQKRVLMKIGELARRTGLTAHTLRYYEKIGLLPDATRDSSGQRDYDESIFEWIEFLGRLKTTGMSIRNMLRYAELRALGASTASERCALLETHRELVQAHLAELQSCLLVLNKKIELYTRASSSSKQGEC